MYTIRERLRSQGYTDQQIDDALDEEFYERTVDKLREEDDEQDGNPLWQS